MFSLQVYEDNPGWVVGVGPGPQEHTHSCTRPDITNNEKQGRILKRCKKGNLMKMQNWK